MQKSANVPVLILVLILIAASAQATNTIKNGWKAAYPDACASLVADVDGCVACHANYPSSFARDQYALDYLSHGSNWAAAEVEDSDGDGQLNGDEVAQCTKPWDASSLVSNESGTWSEIKSLWR